MVQLDIEAALIKWLAEKTGITTYADVPNSRPTEFISVERVGGNTTDIAIDHPTISVECWSGTRAKAAQLAGRIVDLVPEMLYIAGVTHASVSSQLNFPDLESGSPRYQVIIHFATQAIL